ncbi:MAG: hypothetical protein PHQ65_14430 [Bacteroidales bacterium]|nr:hypothetical protein [Bacteroidales bacterium]MDD3666458.1 hypothetical protein [Bacteroidales bacterium]
MKRRISLVAVLACWLTMLFGQQLNESDYHQSLVGESIEIVNDQMSVDMTGVKSSMIRFSVKRNVVLVIRTKEGLRDLNHMLIPEFFDQINITHAPSNIRQEKVYDNVKVDSVAAWKFTGGVENKIQASKRLCSFKTITDIDRYGQLNYYRLSLTGAGVGDTLRLYYAASIPLEENWHHLFSIRMFHHSRWPRRNYHLTWTYPTRIDVDTLFFKSRPVVSKSNGQTVFEWSMTNLAGSLDENNGRPYMELPWFAFNPKLSEFMMLQYSNFDQEYIPSWILMSYHRESAVTLARINVQQGVRTTDLLKFNKVVDTIKQRFPADSSGFKTLGWFQKLMVEKAKYDMDVKYYSNEANYLLNKPGGDMASCLIRDRNRLTAYSNMLLRFDFSVLLAYPMDKRAGTISSKYFPNMVFDDLLFLTVLRDSSLVWIYPISDKARFYADELPFYFENTDVMLTVFTQMRGYKRDMSSDAMFFHTPASKTSDNTRKVNGLVEMDLVNGKAKFSSRVSLSGQYSTICRNTYRGLPVDSTVNMLYHKRVSDISPETKILRTKNGAVADKFPFLTQTTTEYETPLPAWVSDTLTVDLSKWFHHVVDHEVAVGKRFTSYYPDFTGSDSWSFMIKLNQPASLLADLTPVKISNDFGQYSFEIKQLSPTELLVTSYYLVKAPVVAPEKMDQVNQINNAITSGEGHLLKLVRKVE